MPVGSSWDCQAPPASHVFSPSLLPRYNYERDPAMRYEDLAKPPSYADLNGTSGQKDTKYQLSISIALGLASLLGFCILRPRWSALYAARKKQKDAASSLPELPSTLFGWVLPLWRITDQQILASAGLDAYVVWIVFMCPAPSLLLTVQFLRFFRMAGTFLAITCFFALAVIKPVHDVYGDQKRGDGGKDKDKDALFMLQRRFAPSASADFHASKNSTAPDQDQWIATDYLWMYLIFAYLFSILLMYMIVANTRTVIEIRQEFLGSQTTITDRTVRLSGVPADLQSEDKIKSFMEGLEIGKVESVTICRDWSALDDLIARREGVLRKLEKAIVSHDGSAVQSRSSANGTSSRETLPTAVPYRDEEDGHDEDQALLFGGNQAHVTPNQGDRPTKTIRFGRFNLHSKKVDAIDHYQALLKQIDGDIEHLRKTEFATVPMAFVTMDSVAAAQMAIQAVLDPSPLQLLANQSPAPENVIWPNTYLPRRQRMLRAWSITALIVLLTIFWSLLFAPLAYILSIDNIRKALPAVGKWLKDHQFVASLIRTQLPTLVVSLLNIAVPYLYEWLANKQGMTSRSDVELSVISKNFFFTFFNFFVVFTILGTASNLFSLWQSIEERLRNTTFLLHKLAESLGDLVGFYTNFLILQGLGLLPFKLLQVGSLSLYPWYRYGATTPRELAELSQPSVFSYGLFLPQTLLIFDICLVYSVLEDSWQILLSGLVYFIIGSFIYKYQLLYAMDERQHSTGRVWIMMCDRVLVGLIVFQLTVGGQLVLRNIDARGALLLPLVIATIWFSYAYNKTYRPLMQFIALKSVRTAEHLDYPGYTDDELPEDMRRWRDVSGERSRATSRSRESRGKFVNPSLIIPLEGPWVGDKSQLASGGNDDSIGHGDNSV